MDALAVRVLTIKFLSGATVSCEHGSFQGKTTWTGRLSREGPHPDVMAPEVAQGR